MSRITQYGHLAAAIAILTLGATAPASPSAGTELELSFARVVKYFHDNRRIDVCGTPGWNVCLDPHLTPYAIDESHFAYAFDVRLMAQRQWLFAFFHYCHAPVAQDLDDVPWDGLQITSTSHILAAGAGCQLALGEPTVGIKSGLALLSDRFLFRYRGSQGKSKLVSGYGLLLGCHAFVPIHRHVGFVFSYDYIYRNPLESRGRFQAPIHGLLAQEYTVTLEPDQHSLSLGIGVRP
jgi:hypothetical protein